MMIIEQRSGSTGRPFPHDSSSRSFPRHKPNEFLIPVPKPRWYLIASTGGRAKLLANLLGEGLRAAAVVHFVVDDLADQSRLVLGGERGALLDFLRELEAIGGHRRVALDGRGFLLDGFGGHHRLPAHGRLGLRDVAMTEIFSAPARAAAAGTGLGGAERVADAPVASAHHAPLAGWVVHRG